VSPAVYITRTKERRGKRKKRGEREKEERGESCSRTSWFKVERITAGKAGLHNATCCDGSGRWKEGKKRGGGGEEKRRRKVAHFSRLYLRRGLRLADAGVHHALPFNSNSRRSYREKREEEKGEITHVLVLNAGKPFLMLGTGLVHVPRRNRKEGGEGGKEGEGKSNHAPLFVRSEYKSHIVLEA